MEVPAGVKNVIRVIDRYVGRILRHLAFLLVSPFYGLFYNVSCSNKELLQGVEGAIVLSNHVSRHDPPLIMVALYSVTRIRPTAYYKEYQHWPQKWPLMLFSTIPMSSPKEWAPERREAQTHKTLEIMRKVVDNGNSVLIFPSGSIRTGKEEEIPAHFSGAYDTIKAFDNPPVILIKVDGLGKHQYRIYDQFWSFIGLVKGRRHIKLGLELVENIDLGKDCAAFNETLESYFNGGPLPKSKRIAKKNSAKKKLG